MTAGSGCSAWVFSSCGEQGLVSLDEECRLLIAVLCFLAAEQGPRSVQASVVAHRPSMPVTCGIFLDLGSQLCPLHWQVDS